MPTVDMRAEALNLYVSPFRYKHGFIWDANENMVGDQPGQDTALRIRGWGRIGYMQNAERLQDAVGEIIAEALTEFWEKQK